MRSAHASVLRDFSVDRRVWLLSTAAFFIGTGAAALAAILLASIQFSANFFYFHRMSLAAVGPVQSTLGPWMPLGP